MASTTETLDDVSPNSTVINLDIDGPIIEVSGLENHDEVVLLHSMDGAVPADPADRAHIFKHSGKLSFPEFKSGDKIQALGKWDLLNSSRSITLQVRKA